MALGATYDPNLLARLGVVGVSAESERREAGTKRPRPSARRMQDGGSTFWRITSASARSSPGLSGSISICACWIGLRQAAAQKIDSEMRPSFRSVSCLR
jgi:hypothetical protein